MHIAWIDVLRWLGGLAAGCVLGLGFGVLQDLALRRNQKRQQSGALTSGWAVMPGSMSRVAYFLVALVLVQFFCPLLFVNGTQWWVSGGVVAGYGAMLFRQLRRRRAQGLA
jgi:hypothetical protein